MPDEQKSVEDIKSGIKKTLSQLPASDWTDNTGVYDYLKILNTSRELFDVLAEGIIQALSKDPSVNPEVVNSIVKDRAKNAQVADFRPANPDMSVSDKFGENKVVDTDFIYTLINRYNHVLDLLDNLGANGALVKGIKSVKQNLTLLADKQDSMVDLDPILNSVNAAIYDIKKTVSDVQTKVSTVQDSADKALAAITPENISKIVVNLISSGKVKIDDTLDTDIKQTFSLVNKDYKWNSDINDLSNVSKTVIDNSAFGINVVTDAGTILKSYSPDHDYKNYVNLKRSDFMDVPIKVPNSGVNIDPGKNYIKRVQLWTGKVPETDVVEDLSIVDLPYSDTDTTIQGLQFRIVMAKRTMKKGFLSEDSVEIPVVSSLSNEPQAGMYVCTVPIPVSINNISFSKDSDTFEIPFTGIGEGLEIAKESLAPRLTLKYTRDTKKNTISFSVKATEGYALDSVSGENNGAMYIPKIFYINSYAVEQSSSANSELPNGTILWEGFQNSVEPSVRPTSEVKLSKVNPGFSNVGSGIKIHFFAPYLLNKSYAGSHYDYDGSPLSYKNNKGGSSYYQDNSVYYFDPLPRGIAPARMFLNLSNTDEYGRALTDDWLIIPKDHLINNYSIPLLDSEHFFPGQTPLISTNSSSGLEYYTGQYYIIQGQLNDPNGLIRYDSPNSAYSPYFSFLDRAVLVSDLCMSLQIIDHTKLSLTGGLSNKNGSSDSRNARSLLFYWKPANNSFPSHSSLYGYEYAVVSLFAIDRVVSYRV